MPTRFIKIVVFFLLLVLNLQVGVAQEKPAKIDSTNIYDRIEDYSKRSKFTNFIYGLIFQSSPEKSSKEPSVKKHSGQSYAGFEGKTIRNIRIEVLDPFGYSMDDTLRVNRNFLTKTGNTLHIKSMDMTIRNLLLVRENQDFDSLLVEESERLVRKQEYVHDVAFYFSNTLPDSDSVDIFIRELDNWSLLPRTNSSLGKLNINLVEKNFVGLGHRFTNDYTWYHGTGDNTYQTNYFIPNIRNTYITANFDYARDRENNYSQSFSLDRSFFSAYTRWAGGVLFGQQMRKDSMRDAQSYYQNFRLKFNKQDYWLGYAIPLSMFKNESLRSTSLIATLRYYREHYLNQPVESLDTLNLYSNEQFFMGSLGISTRKYVRDHYIYNFGLTEDVPVGKYYNITGGYQRKRNYGRTYLGAGFSFGNYHPWGYLSYTLQSGIFLRSANVEQGVVSTGLHYFTRLFELGSWKMRQFIKPQLTLGINRFVSDSLTLSGEEGLDGFNSTSVSGTSRITLGLQTQMYAPWNLLGFRFGPYFTISLGMLGDEETGFRKSRVYSQIGLGLLVKNDFLVINTFQISLSYYPTIPGVGQNEFKSNAFKTTDFGYQDFDIGKPAVIGYE